MTAHLTINDELVETARVLGGHRTKREAAIKALETYIQRLRQQEIVLEFGQIDYEPDYDYKQQRRRS